MDISDVCKKVAKELNIDKDEVLDIARFQFDFVARVMKDKEDLHDVLINKLFRFKLKNRFKNENVITDKKQCVQN